MAALRRQLIASKAVKSPMIIHFSDAICELTACMEPCMHAGKAF